MWVEAGGAGAVDFRMSPLNVTDRLASKPKQRFTQHQPGHQPPATALLKAGKS